MPMTMIYNFKGDGDVLTGTVSGGPGKLIPIKQGKIDGTKISFEVDVDAPFGSTKMNFTNKYTGVQIGNDLKLSFEAESDTRDSAMSVRETSSPPTTFVARRVK